ncbi:MAG: hypothetical protein K6G28_03775 [Acholeplasmatales bacterium]|nr:hypothetical protein [Acholeplasmatales bacterium]
MEYFVETFLELENAINIALPNSIIHLKDGNYYGKLKITRSDITLIGDGNDCIISNKDYYNKIHNDNKEYLTVRTYTVLVMGNNVTFKNITISNLSVPSSIYGQAVALEVMGDNFNCYNCKLLGAQDTLLCGPLPYDLTVRYKDLLPKDELLTNISNQYYESCYIEGDVDYIFGCGKAIFNKCILHSIGNGYFAAPSHPKEYDFGFIFNECILEASPNVNNVILARPWRDYGHVIYINNKVRGNFLNKSLFNNWVKERESTCRFYVDNTIDISSMVDFGHILNKDEVNQILAKISRK